VITTPHASSDAPTGSGPGKLAEITARGGVIGFSGLGTVVRMARRLAVALTAGALIAVSAATGAAAGTPTQDSGGTVGGPLLASSGVVVRPLAGAPALPAASQLPASSWLVANLTSGQVLAAKAAHQQFLPASTLKVLTAITLLHRLDPRATFAATYRDASVDGTRAGLVPGMSYSIKELFTCMLVDSANDAADALAEANGGIKRTVREMNGTARRLQAYDTVADTPSGLDGPSEHTSAYDLALFAQAAWQIPAFRHYITTVRNRVPAPHHRHFMIYTHNNLLTTYRGDIGGKNGYTVAAGATYVGAATRHGQTIVVTLMHAYPIWWPMAAKLLTWGFQATGKVAPVGTLVKPLPPTAATSGVATPVAHTTLATARGHRRELSPVEVAVIGITLLVATVVAIRRMRPRRYKPRLRLPPL
jgi:D-alanyl-D-alanine carboxypeptidase (penicillin-binding protein 5/6)